MTTTTIRNLSVDLSARLPEELTEALAENQHVRIERIVFHSLAAYRLLVQKSVHDASAGDGK